MILTSTEFLAGDSYLHIEFLAGDSYLHIEFLAGGSISLPWPSTRDRRGRLSTRRNRGAMVRSQGFNPRPMIILDGLKIVCWFYSLT